MWTTPEKFLRFLKLPIFQLRLAPEEIENLLGVPVAERFYPAGSTIMDEGRMRRTLMLVSSGWALSYKLMSNGKRLVVDFPQQGDLVSNGSFTGRGYRSVLAATDLTAFELRFETIEFIAARAPTLSNLMMRLMARNYGIAMEHLANVARRRPVERTAFFFLETAFRIEQGGGECGDSFPFPFTQGDLADALGLTAIHTNRVVRDLREGGLAGLRNGTLSICNRRGLERLTSFDPGYLVLSEHEESHLAYL